MAGTLKAWFPSDTGLQSLVWLSLARASVAALRIPQKPSLREPGTRSDLSGTQLHVCIAPPEASPLVSQMCQDGEAEPHPFSTQKRLLFLLFFHPRTSHPRRRLPARLSPAAVHRPRHWQQLTNSWALAVRSSALTLPGKPFINIQKKTTRGSILQKPAGGLFLCDYSALPR